MPEEFTGIKFRVELAEGERDTSNAGELIKWCRAFYQMGVATPSGETAGNISCRTKRGFLITPSRQNFSKITEEQLVEVIEIDEGTRRIKAIGIIEPSSESFLHAGIYEARGDVNAILHGHCDAVTIHARELGIPETGMEQPYGTLELRDEIRKILDNRFLLQMKGHGFISIGASLEEAGGRAKELCMKANAEFSIEKTGKIPSEEECYEMLKQSNVPENIVRHSEKVKEFALDLAERIGGVNIELVVAGALLHDLDKIETLNGGGYHGEAGWKRLREKGLYAVAEICRKHLLEKVGELTTLEEKIVYYADKRVINEKVVPLKERLKFIKQKYGSRSRELMDKITGSEPLILTLEKELMGRVKK